MYEQGLGCTQDLKQAYRLFRNSAEQGNKDAWKALDNAIYREFQGNSHLSQSDSSDEAIYMNRPSAGEERNSYAVVLQDAGTEKIKVIKIIRELTGLGLKEAKYVVDYLPHTVIEGVSRVQAEQIVDIFHNVGANCVIVAQDTI